MSRWLPPAPLASDQLLGRVLMMKVGKIAIRMSWIAETDGGSNKRYPILLYFPKAMESNSLSFRTRQGDDARLLSHSTEEVISRHVIPRCHTQPSWCRYIFSPSSAQLLQTHHVTNTTVIFVLGK